MSAYKCFLLIVLTYLYCAKGDKRISLPQGACRSLETADYCTRLKSYMKRVCPQSCQDSSKSVDSTELPAVCDSLRLLSICDRNRNFVTKVCGRNFCNRQPLPFGMNSAEWIEITDAVNITAPACETGRVPLHCNVNGVFVAPGADSLFILPGDPVAQYGSCLDGFDGPEAKILGCLDDRGARHEIGELLLHGRFWWICRETAAIPVACSGTSNDKAIFNSRFQKRTSLQNTQTYVCRIVTRKKLSFLPYSCDFHIEDREQPLRILPGCYTVFNGRKYGCKVILGEKLQSLSGLAAETQGLSKCAGAAVLPEKNATYGYSNTTGRCREGMLQCSNGNCIPYAWVCDGDKDCQKDGDGNNDDEINCQDQDKCLAPDGFQYSVGEVARYMDSSGNGNLQICSINATWQVLSEYCVIAGAVYSANDTYKGFQPGREGWGYCEGRVSSRDTFYHAQGCIDPSGKIISAATSRLDLYLSHQVWRRCQAHIDSNKSKLYAIPFYTATASLAIACNAWWNNATVPPATNVSRSFGSADVIFECETKGDKLRLSAKACAFEGVDFHLPLGCYASFKQQLLACKTKIQAENGTQSAEPLRLSNNLINIQRMSNDKMVSCQHIVGTC